MTGVAIGIDVGTSGVRAALVDAAGTPVAWGAAPLPAERKRNPAAWWDGVAQALDALRAGASLRDVRGIAVDGTSGTVLPVDGAGNPVGPASMYNDPADTAQVARVAAAAPRDSAAHGATSPLAKFLALQGTAGMIADPAMAPREQPRPADDARFLHGLLEGVARVEALAYARLAQLGAPRLRTLRTVGGGARNAVWTALRCRLLRVEFDPSRSEEAAAGVARLALRAIGG